MKAVGNPQVSNVFNNYPENVRKKLFALRQLILDTAEGAEQIGAIEETLKWGEPGYLAQGGSTLRLGWKQSLPDQYALYFNCKTRLIETIREFYRDTFNYDGKRALLFALDEQLPEKELKHCIELALTYHRIKHLPMLGI